MARAQRRLPKKEARFRASFFAYSAGTQRTHLSIAERLGHSQRPVENPK
jgi:hypothetical protein